MLVISLRAWFYFFLSSSSFNTTTLLREDIFYPEFKYAMNQWRGQQSQYKKLELVKQVQG